MHWHPGLYRRRLANAKALQPRMALLLAGNGCTIELAGIERIANGGRQKFKGCASVIVVILH